MGYSATSYLVFGFPLNKEDENKVDENIELYKTLLGGYKINDIGIYSCGDSRSGMHGHTFGINLGRGEQYEPVKIKSIKVNEYQINKIKGLCNKYELKYDHFDYYLVTCVL